MRIAYICLDPGVPVFGRKGSSVHCQEVMRAFQQRGSQVELFTNRLGEDVPGDLEGIRTHQLPCRLSRKPAEREQALIDLNSQIHELLQRAEPFDVVYERFSLWSHAAMEFADERGIPGVLEVNSPLINEQKTYRTLINESAAKSIRAKCFRSASSMIAVSEQVAQQVRQNYFARFKTTVVPNGVNCQRFQAVANDPKNCHDPKKIVIGFVGTLKPWHGVATLIEAFAIAHSKNPDVVLRIVGDGPQLQQLKDLLPQYSQAVQQSVQWLGAIPNSLMPQMLSTFDIAVAPYPDLSDFYFSPLKILEYMAAGLPIVASRIGQIPKLIGHGVSGLLPNPGCPQSLAASILRLSVDPDLRTRLGKTARRQAEDNHSWQHVVDRVLSTIPVADTPSHCGTC